jgi:hypothetical protein
VLRAVVRGYSNAEIARASGVREDTVKWHVTCILRCARLRYPDRSFYSTADLEDVAGELLSNAVWVTNLSQATTLAG